MNGMKEILFQQLLRARLVTFLRQVTLVEARRDDARRCPTPATIATLRSAEQQRDYFEVRLRAAVTFAKSAALS
jgi:hypothetical protein